MFGETLRGLVVVMKVGLQGLRVGDERPQH